LRNVDVGELPNELAPLATIQGYRIDRDYFDRDARYLVGQIETQIFPTASPPMERRAAIATALAPQLRLIWIVLFIVTMIALITPAFVPGLPQMVWVFPCALTIAVFVSWLACLSVALGGIPSVRPA
jgi:hypothetical protein